MKRVTVERLRGWYGAARALAIEVDGEKRGALRHRETLTLDLADTDETLIARMDWGRTDPVDLRSLPDGAHIDIHASPRVFFSNPLQWFGIGGLPFTLTVRP